MLVGIDVGANRLDCVGIADDGEVLRTALFSASEISALVGWAAGASVVAIDAPAQLSTAPHAGDEHLAPKFRAARCAEIALGREHGSWVPWVTPEAAPGSGWIRTGLDLHRAFAAGDSEAAIEVFPLAAFRELAGGRRLAKKSTVTGIRQRVEVLEFTGIGAERLTMRSHDALDALVAAAIAQDHAAGRARAVTCGHDRSAIWLPAARERA